MADRAVVKIPVDLAEWDKFIDSWNHYNAQLEKNSDAWAGTNKGIRQQKTAFDEVDKSFSDLVEKATAGKFSGSSGAFVKITKSSKETEKSWRNIARDLEKSAKSMTGLARNGLNFSALGGLGLLGAAAGAAGGIFAGVRSADNSLAQQNILNRKLNLKPGEEKAFDTVFEKAGGDTALLSKVAAAQSDPSQWRYLQAAGIPLQDIQTKGTEELSESFLKHVGGKVRELGPQQFGMWALAQGITNFADVNSLRQAGSYSDADYDKMHGEYKQLQPQLAAQQKDLDAATAARQKIEADLAKDALALDLVFIKLNPLITGAADAFAGWVTKLSDSGELDKDIAGVTTAFQALGTAASKLEEALDWLADKEKPAASQQGQIGRGLLDAYADLKAGNVEKAWADLNRPINDTSADKQVTGKHGDNGAGTGGAFNNPGNLRIPGSTTQFQHFDNADQGALAMDRQLQLYAQRDHLNTLRGIISKYSPNSENDTESYINDVRQRTGFGAAEALNMSDPKVRAAIESAMIHHEGTPYARQFDTKHILDLLTGKATPFTDPAALKTARAIDGHSDPARVPDSVDRRAVAEQTQQKQPKTDQQAVGESITDRLTRAAQMLRDSLSNDVGSIVHDSGVTARRIDRQGNTPNAPYNVNVTVSTPAGNSTVITSGGLAQ